MKKMNKMNEELEGFEYEEIKLPSESEYPKKMIVSDNENYNHCTETYVLGEYKHMYICVNKTTLELIDIDEDTDIVLTKYAKDIEPKEEVKEVKHLLK